MTVAECDGQMRIVAKCGVELSPVIEKDARPLGGRDRGGRSRKKGAKPSRSCVTHLIVATTILTSRYAPEKEQRRYAGRPYWKKVWMIELLIARVNGVSLGKR